MKEQGAIRQNRWQRRRNNRLNIKIYRPIPVELSFWERLRFLFGAKANVMVEIDLKTAEPTNRGAYLQQ